MLLMTNCENPIQSYSPETISELESYKGLKPFLEMCFVRDKTKRPNASQLLQCPFFTEEQ